MKKCFPASHPSWFVAILFFSFPIVSCKKDNPQCNLNIGYEPILPYNSPSWEPGGNLLVFNSSPLSAVEKEGSSPCDYYADAIKPDSVGFYIMNKGGSGLRRISNFYLTNPVWSPDGNWLAFSAGSQIYKIRFTGNDFDTTNIVQLTTAGQNFFPSWTANGDTIYFDSNENAPPGTDFYSIWKMSSDGTGKTLFQDTTREPFVGVDNRVYYLGYSGETEEIFSINRDGTDKRQLTFTGNLDLKDNIKYYNGTLFYWYNGRINSTPVTTYAPKELLPCFDDGYDISNKGELVYTNSEFPVQDLRFGTLWTAHIDGSNKLQITLTITKNYSYGENYYLPNSPQPGSCDH